MKRPSRKELRDFLKTDRAILMVCIGIAFVFWLLTKMSYVYQRSLSIPVAYETPTGKVLSIRPPEQLDVDIEASGWELLGIYFGDEEAPLTVDLSQEAQQNISAIALQSRLNRRFEPANVLDIRPDALALSLEDTATKIIPVRLDSFIRLAPQTKYVDSILIQPAQIKITGPASIIRDINEWSTVPLIMQNVKQSFDRRIALRPPKNKSITLSPNSVRCAAAIEQITEKDFELPIEVRNAPDSLLLVILPRKVRISCVVGLSDYERLRPQSLKPFIDFKDFPIYQERAIRLHMDQVPPFILDYTLSHQKVDYIIRSE